jgi:hypothetical protein
LLLHSTLNSFFPTDNSEVPESRQIYRFKSILGNGASKPALRGIREQENEDISEITYRASNIYIKDESCV